MVGEDEPSTRTRYSFGWVRRFLRGGLDVSWILPAAAALVLPARAPQQELGNRPQQGTTRAWIAIAVGGQFAVVAVLPGAHITYVVPALPLLGILGAAGVGGIVDVLAALATSGRHVARRAVGVVALIATVAVGAGWAAASARYGNRDRRDYGVNPYGRRLEMSRLQDIRVVEQIAEHIGAAGEDHGTLFGHSTIVAAVALRTGRRIAGGLADFDPGWIERGTASRRETVHSIEIDLVEYFITPNWFFMRDPWFSSYLRHCYAPPHEIDRRPARGEGGGGEMPGQDLRSVDEDHCVQQPVAQFADVPGPIP